MLTKESKLDVLREFKGVTWDAARDRWKVMVGFAGKVVNVGRFKSEESAATAYNFAAFELFGEFSRGNLP
jgi:hypothetical protein